MGKFESDPGSRFPHQATERTVSPLAESHMQQLKGHLELFWGFEKQ
jgi:hypothetical protein